MNRSTAIASILVALTASTAYAVEANVDATARDYLTNVVTPWMADPVVVEAIKAQNAAHAGLTDDDIAALDQTWIDEASIGGAAMYDEIAARAVSQYLTEMIAGTDGIVAEVWIMDSRGLNVGQTALTSDYMQGDEAKWQNTYPAGPGAVDIGDVEFAEELQAFTFNASMTIVDPATGEAIGAFTVGFNADLLM